MLPALQSRVLSDDDLSKHRAYIAVKAKALMSRYFQPSNDELVEREILLGWMDMLQDYTKAEIDKACRDYLVQYPSRRPHEGLVRGLIHKERQRVLETQRVVTALPDRPTLTPEELEHRRKTAAEIMRGFGKR